MLGAVWGPPQVAQSLRLCSDFSSAVSPGVPGGICEDSNHSPHCCCPAIICWAELALNSRWHCWWQKLYKTQTILSMGSSYVGMPLAFIATDLTLFPTFRDGNPQQGLIYQLERTLAQLWQEGCWVVVLSQRGTLPVLFYLI